jgi:hypothetical protein
MKKINLNFINKSYIWTTLFGIILMITASEFYLFYVDDKFSGTSTIQGFRIGNDSYDLNPVIEGLKGGSQKNTIVDYIERKRNVKLSNSDLNLINNILDSAKIGSKPNTVNLSLIGSQFTFVHQFLEDVTEAITISINMYYTSEIKDIKKNIKIADEAIKYDEKILDIYIANSHAFSLDEKNIMYFYFIDMKNRVNVNKLKKEALTKKLDSYLTHPARVIEKSEDSTIKIFPKRIKVYKFSGFMIFLFFTLYYFRNYSK